MKKANPLFNDTSKITGEPILTVIELTGMNSIYGEIIYAVIKQEKGQDIRQPLWHLGHGKWRAELYLKHNTEIRYQFFLSHEGNIVDCTPEEKAYVGYLIETKWKSIREKEDDENQNSKKHFGLKELKKDYVEPLSQYLQDYIENKQ